MESTRTIRDCYFPAKVEVLSWEPIRIGLKVVYGDVPEGGQRVDFQFSSERELVDFLTNHTEHVNDVLSLMKENRHVYVYPRLTLTILLKWDRIGYALAIKCDPASWGSDRHIVDPFQLLVLDAFWSDEEVRNALSRLLSGEEIDKMIEESWGV